MLTPAEEHSWQRKSITIRFEMTWNILFAVDSFVKFRLLHALSATWPTVKTMPPVWNGGPCTVPMPGGFGGPRCEKLVSVNFVDRDSYLLLSDLENWPQANITLQVFNKDQTLNEHWMKFISVIVYHLSYGLQHTELVHLVGALYNRYHCSNKIHFLALAN